MMITWILVGVAFLIAAWFLSPMATMLCIVGSILIGMGMNARNINKPKSE